MKIVLKIFKYILYIFLFFILIISVYGGYYAIKYNNVVKHTPSHSNQQYKPLTLSSLVNPFIGTGGFPSWVCGYNFPGASVPFGLVKLGPETMSFYKDTKGYSTSGYYYGDSKIIGFSHTRLIGTGATDGGHILVTPTTKMADQIDFNTDLTHTFSHKNEVAFPGYYAVLLDKENIQAEMTTSKRSGFHRYTFQENIGNLLLNISNANGGKKAKDGYVKLAKDHQTISGYITTFGSFSGRYDGIKVYFVGKLNHPVQTASFWNGEKLINNTTELHGDDLKVYLGFKEMDSPIELKIALSHVSLENAFENLKTEIEHKAFSSTLEEAQKAWESKLESIQLEGGNLEQQKVFYSALYRSFQMPTLFNDVNGDYKGFDKNIHQVDSFNYYTDMSLWDTYRTTHPLYNLIARKKQRDMMVSLTKMAEQGGTLPRWPSGYGYTGSMFGSPADMTIAEAYLKGITDFDIDLAYNKMKMVATNQVDPNLQATKRGLIESYIQNGYVTTESGEKAVSRTLEFAWADYSIALLADRLGKTKDAAEFYKRSQYYSNVWNPETKYFQSRYEDGSFVDKFKPLKLTYFDFDKVYTKDYVEGSALQWRWAVPHDPKGLIDLFGGNENFAKELNRFFEKSNPKKATWQPGSYYWHGNQPDIHAAYLFNWAERPDLTQKWVRWILDNKYDNSYVGIDGNDDGGTLSAWYVFSALGFYPIAGTDVYQLGAPLFKKANINMGHAFLTVTTENYHANHKYVKAVYLNDKKLTNHHFKHQDIANGGHLHFVMSKTAHIK